jgi:hypothetical protein
MECSKSDSFWNEFRRYRLLNRNNKAISNPFYRVLTVLLYICSPIVEDWVNARAVKLEKCIDTTTPHHITETDEVLWNEFEAVFKSAWGNTAKTQSVYDQLMKLTMKDLDVDTYNATFNCLAATAEWEPDVKGTIARYRAGLHENIHQQVVNREKLTYQNDTMEGSCKKEVGRSRSSKVLDSSAHAETNHVTNMHTKQTNTHPIPRPTTSTSPWTLTLQIYLFLS